MGRKTWAMAATWVAVGAAGVPAQAPAPPQARPFSVLDLVSVDRVSDPQPSPDGRRVAFVRSVLDLEANRRRTDLWLVGSDGAGLVRLTTHEAGDSHPRWSADGRFLYFLSTRSGSSQVWRIASEGGEAEPVTKEPLDVAAFLPSPDGTTLALAMDVFPDCATPACTRERLDARGARKATGRVYDGLLVRHWDAWAAGTRSHWFVRPIAGGPTRDLMPGMAADAPSKPFGGAEEAAFSGDGRVLVFAARDAGREEAWSTNLDLFAVPVDGSAPPRKLTGTNAATDTFPVFSPDGRTLAWLAMARPGYESDRQRIVVRPWPEGEPRVLTEAWDRSPGEIAWAPDGRSIVATAHDLGNAALFSVDARTGAVRRLVANGTVKSPAFAGDRVVFAHETLTRPAELASVRPDGSDFRLVTGVNAERLRGVRFGRPEAFTFTGAGGDTVHGVVVRPADFEPGRKYPVAFLIHGGPQGSFGDEFHFRWNPQAYAGGGFATVAIDFHGSVGYGQAFTDAIRNDWGGKPLEDLQKGLEAALSRYPWLDGDRVAALGASYGGWMVNWIASQWPDRFRALVTHDGNLDERMAYFTTEELWFPEWEHGGTPWANPEGYAKHNPIDHVGAWKTPMLVIHGALDYRVVYTGGLATFTALQRRGIPSRFLFFPDENHWVLKPQNSILWHRTVLNWLDHWLRGGPLLSEDALAAAPGAPSGENPGGD
jgi:dipeptidyl aminopeptidase/acylaminoacyl peptidase